MNRRPTTQDITWLLDLAANKQLDLSPPYQRRSVWTRRDKQFFLDTIFRNYPSPAIFLHKTMNDDGKAVYHVVDRKQRLQTILDFVAGKLRIADDFGDVRLAGKKWNDILPDQDLKYLLWNYQLTIEFLNDIEVGLVNTVFDRLNRNSRKLTQQELRHAKFDGWFITTAETEAKAEQWKTLGVVTTSRATRMLDTQFISELMLVVLEHKMLGFDQEALDEFYGKYDDPENPENPVEGFDEDRFSTEFGNAKRYLLDMEAANECLSNYTRQYYAMYTLWAFVVLEFSRLPPPNQTAVRYAQFMADVQHLSQQDDILEFLRPAAIALQYENAYKYYANTRGANTDLPAREERLAALKLALLP
jgi:hypothetical protein